MTVNLYIDCPCIQDSSSSSLMDDMEWRELGNIPSRPSNLLNPPMWSTHSATINGHCGNWQKQYTKMHRGNELQKYVAVQIYSYCNFMCTVRTNICLEYNYALVSNVSVKLLCITYGT